MLLAFGYAVVDTGLHGLSEIAYSICNISMRGSMPFDGGYNFVGLLTSKILSFQCSRTLGSMLISCAKSAQPALNHSVCHSYKTMA